MSVAFVEVKTPLTAKIYDILKTLIDHGAYRIRGSLATNLLAMSSPKYFGLLKYVKRSNIFVNLDPTRGGCSLDEYHSGDGKSRKPLRKLFSHLVDENTIFDGKTFTFKNEGLKVDLVGIFTRREKYDTRVERDTWITIREETRKIATQERKIRQIRVVLGKNLEAKKLFEALGSGPNHGFHMETYYRHLDKLFKPTTSHREDIIESDNEEEMPKLNCNSNGRMDSDDDDEPKPRSKPRSMPIKKAPIPDRESEDDEPKSPPRPIKKAPIPDSESEDDEPKPRSMPIKKAPIPDSESEDEDFDTHETGISDSSHSNSESGSYDIRSLYTNTLLRMLREAQLIVSMNRVVNELMKIPNLEDRVKDEIAVILISKLDLVTIDNSEPILSYIRKRIPSQDEA